MLRACRFAVAGVMVIAETTVTVALALFPPAVGVAVTVQVPEKKAPYTALRK